MVFFWGKATAAAVISAKLERLREAERVLIELAYQQNDSTNKTTATTKVAANPLSPRIQPFDTIVPISCIQHHTDVATGSQCLAKELSKNLEQQRDESYKVHGISIISQNIEDKAQRCDKPLVLLHGYSK